MDVLCTWVGVGTHAERNQIANKLIYFCLFLFISVYFCLFQLNIKSMLVICKLDSQDLCLEPAACSLAINGTYDVLGNYLKVLVPLLN